MGWVGFLFFAGDAHAARLYFNAQRESVLVGESRLFEIRLDSEGEYINAGEIEISYPKDIIRVSEIYDGSSIFDIFIARPKVISEGTIFLSGGASSPFIGDGLIGVVAFEGIHAGEGVFVIGDSSRVLLADGQGNEVVLQKGQKQIQVVSFDTKGGSGSGASGVAAPKLFSPTHPNPAVFYPFDQAVVTWELSDDYEYSYVLSKRVEEPDDIVEDRVSSVSFLKLEDGIYFFNLKPIQKGTGFVVPFASLRIMVDTTPPETVRIATNRDSANTSTTIIALTSSDKTSGIDRFEFKTDVAGEYVESAVPFFEIENAKRLFVRVYDKAGNVTEKEFVLSREYSFWFLGVLTGILIGLAAYFFFDRRRHVGK